jgi:hypothetical protein
VIGLVTAEAQKRQREERMAADAMAALHEGEHEGEPDKTADVTTRYDGGVPKAHVEGEHEIPEPEHDGEALPGRTVHKPMAPGTYQRPGLTEGRAAPAPQDVHKVSLTGLKVSGSGSWADYLRSGKR